MMSSELIPSINLPLRHGVMLVLRAVRCALRSIRFIREFAFSCSKPFVPLRFFIQNESSRNPRKPAL